MIGRVISHYRVIEELGRGGMGIVYKAEDTRLHRNVALKLLPQETAKDPSALKRFRREAQAASALDHPNICTIYDIDEDDGQPFIVMQFLDGVTLRDRMGGKPLDIDEIVDLGIQIADALDCAHKKGLVHRDIKPGNIFITSDGKAKLLDFGLATFRTAVGQNDDLPTLTTTRPDLSTTGLVIGTISYMSPEQALGKELDAHTDLFSLAVVFYEMVSGKLPFGGNTAAATFDAILHATPRELSAERQGLPSDLTRIIMKALGKAPEQRHQSAAALRSELLLLRRSLEAAKLSPGSVPQNVQQSMKHPDRIGKYEIEEYLGGGMSHVYRGKDPILGKTVAIKILTADATSDPESRSRFLREARMAAGIEHPNIITVYDYGEDAGRPYMVMEFLKGEDLRTVIKTGRTGSLADKLRIALQIAKALQYVHAQKIIHRDIKPENIHINPTGVVKMMDFGIAKTEDLTITRPGFTMGTPYYMAPEQIRGEEVTPLVDVYAYGILLFELFTGSRPITGENVEQIFFRILQGSVDLQPLAAAGIPQSIIDLVRLCTAKDPAQRPQNFSDICETLGPEIEKLAAPQPKPAASTTTTPSSRRWMIVGALSLILLVVLGVIVYRPTKIELPRETPKTRELSTVLQTPSGEMVLIPEGQFLSGADKLPVKLAAFYIDKTEVSNEAYGKFCAATNKPSPAGLADAPPDFPAVNLTIDDARQFARWAGKRLPTLKEWQKAARGPDGLEYPWGNDSRPSAANVGGAALASVNSFSTGKSPYGALQMVGNVWEFVDELSKPSSQAIQNFRQLLKPPPSDDEPWYLIMGGSYKEPLLPGVTYDTAFVPAGFRSSDIGFRCVKDPQ